MKQTKKQKMIELSAAYEQGRNEWTAKNNTAEGFDAYFVGQVLAGDFGKNVTINICGNVEVK